MDILKQLTIWLASGVEAAAAVLIGLAAIEATLRSLLLFLPSRDPGTAGRHSGYAAGPHQDAKEAVRLRLGRWLAVALEFELVADILRTAVAPTGGHDIRRALDLRLAGRSRNGDRWRAVPIDLPRASSG